MSQRLAFVPTQHGPAPVLVMLEHGPFIVHQTTACTTVRGERVFCGGIDFTLTHAASGFSVHMAFEHPADALDAAEEIAPLADWNFTSPDAVKAWAPEVKTAVVNAVNERLPLGAKPIKEPA